MSTKAKSARKTITRSELACKAICNSKTMPQTVVDDGVVKEWVGIGWITLSRKPLDTDTTIV